MLRTLWAFATASSVAALRITQPSIASQFGLGFYQSQPVEMVMHSPETLTISAQWNDTCAATYRLNATLASQPASAELAYESVPQCSPSCFQRTTVHRDEEYGAVVFASQAEACITGDFPVTLQVAFQGVDLTVLSTSSSSSSSSSTTSSSTSTSESS